MCGEGHRIPSIVTCRASGCFSISRRFMYLLLAYFIRTGDCKSQCLYFVDNIDFLSGYDNNHSKDVDDSSTNGRSNDYNSTREINVNEDMTAMITAKGCYSCNVIACDDSNN